MIGDMQDASRSRWRRWWPVAAAIPAVLLPPFPSSAAATTDPLLPRQWALDQVHAATAWAASTGSGVRVGIVDTGVDLAHEDLVG
jgi:subtilisin family serine protease